MTKTVMYKYLGTNGIIVSPVHLEDAYYVRVVCLRADENKILTNGTVRKNYVTVAENEVDLWKEVDK